MIDAQFRFRQFLVSDSFPNINPSAISCVWRYNLKLALIFLKGWEVVRQVSKSTFFFRFRAETGMVIKLSWREFHLDNCGKSSLRIFDGMDPDTSPLAKTLCGLRKPEIFVSSGMFIAIILD